MSFGLELTNDSGSLVIGTVYSQVYFHQKLTGSFPSSYPTGNITAHVITLTTTISNPSFRPIVFYELELGGICYAPIRVYYSGGLWRVDVAGGKNGSATIYVFTEKDAAPSGWGLQTFDDQGNLSFDSSSLPLIISGRLKCNRPPDVFTDWQDVYPGQDIFGGYVTLGVKTENIPLTSESTKLCISVPPAFYGVGMVDSPLTYYYMSAFTKISETQVRVGDPANNLELGEQNEIVGSLNVNTPNGLGLGISAALWESTDVSFMDGNIYS